MVDRVERLTNPARDYAWGVVDGLAGLVGTAATGGPEAELWIGAHPSAPSVLDDGTTLDAAIAAAPEALLGDEVVARFGARLPYLLKVLAIGRALSVQLHPDAEQAAAGYAREEAEGPDRDAPDRIYRDPYAKPEMLVALRPTTILVGLRSGDDAASLLRTLGAPAADALADAVDGRPDARSALVGLVTADADARAALATAAASVGNGRGRGPTGPATRPPGAPAAPEEVGDDPWPWVARLAAWSPADPAALAPLVLGLRVLAPGDAVFLAAGIPHAYLEGAGVELMGASDNVVRGGLTSKHVDPESLAGLMARPGTEPTVLAGVDLGEGIRRYDPPVPEIALHRLTPGDGELAVPTVPRGPALLVATDGPAAVTRADDTVLLDAGGAALVTPDERDGATVTGPGTVWLATVGGTGSTPDG